LISNHQDVVLEGGLQGLGVLDDYDDDRVQESIATEASSTADRLDPVPVCANLVA